MPSGSVGWVLYAALSLFFVLCAIVVIRIVADALSGPEVWRRHRSPDAGRDAGE